MSAVQMEYDVRRTFITIDWPSPIGLRAYF